VHPFRHLGFFPDMAPVWDWMGSMLGGKADASCLNLFGYTGVGTLALSRFGSVTHVDASKKSVAQARANAALSGMDRAPSAGSSMTRPSSRRAKSVAASAMTASSWTRPSSAAAPMARSGVWKSICPVW
jgi:hypothetical protein